MTSSLPAAAAAAAAGAAAGVVLVLEASTVAGSVAVFRGGVLACRDDVVMGASREDALFPAIQAILVCAGASASELTAVVCGAGPGSFTSLRIAASVAKGLAHATGAPLFAVPSLLLAAASHGEHGAFVVHADALRGERYAMSVTIDTVHGVQSDGVVTRASRAEIDAFAGDRRQLVVLGGVSTMIESPVRPDAAAVFGVHDWWSRGSVSLDEWQPAYGRLAEAQVKWEAAHARALPTH